MSDTIKFKRYLFLENDLVHFSAQPTELPGDKSLTKCSGKAIDYGEISPRTADYATKEMLSHLNDALLYSVLFKDRPRKPPTRRERIERWFVVRWERVVTAWKVLRGDPIQVEED